MIKKTVIIIAVFLALTASAIFIYRYQILQYTAETLIRKHLPGYVKINAIKFDFRKSDIILDGLKVLNPPGFSSEYLAKIGKITCHYKMRGKAIMDGIELTGPVLSNIELNIERLADGKLNLAEAQALISPKTPARYSVAAGPGKEGGDSVPQSNSKGLAGGVSLPESFSIKNGKVIFTDALARANPSVITFENINAELTLKAGQNYTNILSIYSKGEGCVNGDSSQIVKWTSSFDPTAPRLTMANRFDVSDVVIMPFEPYYDKYSPLVFKAGKFSGLLIFDFDNGIIGSSDEIRLSGIKFFIKPGYENTQFMETTVQDLVKYFTSPYGEIIFDFKIKGDMSAPTFYLGPKSKETLISMAVDKISAAIQKSQGPGNSSSGSSIDKAKDYIDLFKGLIKK